MAFAIDSTTWRSPNHSARPAGTDIWAFIIHSCEGKPAGDEQRSSIPWLCASASQVSCHYYVTREGLIYQLVNDDRQSWHAGTSMLNDVWYTGRYSIGVELEHSKGAAPYPKAQIDALTWLARMKIGAYAIPRYGIATHRKIAMPAGRKIDPTDWSDADFARWSAALYIPIDPLSTHTLPGIPGMPLIQCSAAAQRFYLDRGGLFYNGYPLHDEYWSTMSDNAACSILACERVIIKSSDGYGTEQALLSEALAQGWLP